MHNKVGFGDGDHGATVGQDCPMSATTGGFTSAGLELEATTLMLASLTQAQALEIGEIAVELGRARRAPIAIDVRMGEWIVFHASLPGSTPENDSWIARKARVVRATGRSTMHERVAAEERGVDWYVENNLSEELHAIHGGALALNVSGLGCMGVLIISGLPQVDDHLFAVEVITEFLARKGEEA
jgi:uncharacterized protein (UPF0303 family)